MLSGRLRHLLIFFISQDYLLIIRILLLFALVAIFIIILISQKTEQSVVQLICHLMGVHVRKPALRVLLIGSHDRCDQLLGRLERTFARRRINLDSWVILVLFDGEEKA